ncbi:phytanoyl-CoA dioxygenase family protein [Candidatus Pelagibacter sp.]|nr:phytanoyl-CoA dioxygenase family protein [Candidatus Pelagibacter sp.]
MIVLNTPNGFSVDVPENINEDTSIRFNINSETEQALKYYKDNGYVIFSKLVTAQNCIKIRKIWEKDIKPYQGTIYRQTTAKAEKNLFNKNNWIMNPILNLQSLNPNIFNDLRNAVESEIFSNNLICAALKCVLGEKPKIVQSMYFEGNSATWEHQDSYYLDSEKIGSMTAAWLALEEIKADAGRFFICPKSHKIELGKQNINNNIAENHDKYISEVVSIIKSKNMKIKAPYLEAGDVLLWNSWTIHGSIDSQNEEFSRSSITLHAIPESHIFLEYHARKTDLQTDDLGNSVIYRPKDQSKLINRLVLNFETNFPNFFYWLKKKAIKSLIKKNS